VTREYQALKRLELPHQLKLYQTACGCPKTPGQPGRQTQDWLRSDYAGSWPASYGLVMLL